MHHQPDLELSFSIFHKINLLFAKHRPNLKFHNFNGTFTGKFYLVKVELPYYHDVLNQYD